MNRLSSGLLDVGHRARCRFLLLAYLVSLSISSERINPGLEDNPMADDRVRTGLLDMAVELSSPELFAGEHFTVYLIVKNPFDRPIWIRAVTVNVPSQMHWRGEGETEKHKDMPGESESHPKANDLGLIQAAANRREKIETLRNEIQKITSTDSNGTNSLETLATKQEQLEREQAALLTDELHLSEQLGRRLLLVGDNSEIAYRGVSDQPLFIAAGKSAQISASSNQPLFIRAGESSEISVSSSSYDARNREISIRGSVSAHTALESGSTGVWPVVFGTNRNLLFLPSQYRLQFTVLYGFEAPEKSDNLPERSTRADTIAKTLTVRASIWALMCGAVVGAIVGALARALQGAESWKTFQDEWGTLALATLLSCILSIAAVIFTARKSDTQSFISVEDFWGGALIGFVIGYSGTAAFAKFAGTIPGAFTSGVPTSAPTH